MRYREKLNIVLMRDNGPRASFRLKRSNFILITTFFCCLPFIVILLMTQCWFLWQENTKLRNSMERFETDYQLAEARAERLENLEELLNEENVQAREVALRQLAPAQQKKDAVAEKAAEIAETPPELVEGPGHEDFPVLDTGRVLVNNVQARARQGNNLRIGLDLRNPDSEPLLSGEVEAILVTANGERRSLTLTPADVGSFRIARFKRTVMNATVPRELSLENAQIILEVKDQDEKPIYRNIYSVQR